jgi:hypothetical protein
MTPSQNLKFNYARVSAGGRRFALRDSVFVSSKSQVQHLERISQAGDWSLICSASSNFCCRGETP